MTTLRSFQTEIDEISKQRQALALATASTEKDKEAKGKGKAPVEEVEVVPVEDLASAPDNDEQVSQLQVCVLAFYLGL